MTQGVIAGSRAPIVALHILATCAVTCMHAINITLPWTIGVYMIRDYMSIAAASSQISPLESGRAGAPKSWGDPAMSPSPGSYPHFKGPPMFSESDIDPSMRSTTDGSDVTLQPNTVALEARVAYQAGILSAAFSVSQVLTAMAWGNLANRSGTKVLIQISQASAALANIALGFAPTFWWAVATRFSSGLLNSITGAMKTNVAQSFHLKHQPYVFSLTMSSWAVGAILGPVLGGVLAEPCRTWPALMHTQHCENPRALLFRFPFILPCLMTAVLCAASFVVTALALSRSEDVLDAWSLDIAPAGEDEPLVCEAVKAGHDGSRVGEEDTEHGEVSGVLPAGQFSPRAIAGAAEVNDDTRACSGLYTDACLQIHSLESGQGGQSVELSEMRMLGKVEHSDDRPILSMSSQGSSHKYVSSPVAFKTAPPHPLSPGSVHSCGSPQSPWWKDRQVRLRLMGYASLAIMFSTLAESLPIYASMPLRHHGLAWSSAQLAVPSGIGGLFLMGSATLLYPRVNKAFGCKRTILCGLFLMIPVTMVYPSLSFLAEKPHATMAVLAILYGIQNIAINFTFASGNVLVNEAAMKPELKEQIGSVNGAGHMLSSAVRALGPVLAGVVWSAVTVADVHGGVFLPFAICTCLAIANIKLYCAV